MTKIMRYAPTPKCYKAVFGLIFKKKVMKRSILMAIFCYVFAQPVFAAIGIDANKSTDRSTASTTISSPTFSTISANELLLAFIATDAPRSGTNTTVSSITGGSLNWVLVRRTNTQRGTAEVWRTFASQALTNISVTATLSRKTAASITVVSFTGVDTTGTNGSGAIGATASGNAASGAPTASLTTTRNDSWVFGVGNDWDNAITRTLPANQTIVHQYLATIGDTYWVQRQASPTPTSGTVVTINDTAPTGDQYNLSIVEVLPPAGSGGSTFSISGAISPAANGGGATLTLAQSGTTVATATANVSGIYSFANVSNGTYTVTPSKAGFTFSPVSQQVTVNGADVTVSTFTAQGTPSSLLYPDLSVIIPTDRISIVGTGSSRQFQYTHDTFNGGAGPLVIQPALNSASGNYQGTQYIYSFSSTDGWSIASENPVAGAFIFHATHGHFHFPLVTFGLYNVGADGGLGTPAVLSEKNGFCINDSFIYDPSLPHAGEFGIFGSCSDPTTLRGLHIGAVDEYDKTDPGQSISIPTLPDGTYWLRALVDPDNFLAESDKTNNETDVLLTITGNTVQIQGNPVTPVLNAPPAITLTAPLSGIFVSGNVVLTASTATTSGVQYLLDGLPYGGIVSAAPSYSLSWNTTTVPDGAHWVAAQTRDSTGIIGTSEVAVVTVSNAASSGPVVQLTDPANGSILSATATLYTTVASNQPIDNVKFYVDGQIIGNPVTAPPYSIPWNTTTVVDGQYVITVSATDTLGNVGNSPPVTVNVDNSHPANLIGKDVSVSVDGQGTMTTPPFSTSTANDLLLAFVAYDGPLNSAQTANVSGAGLTWTLLERSNTQAGTAEIWSARANGTLSNLTVSSQPGNGSGYHGSLTVIAFTNAFGTSVVGRAGAPSGEPDIYIPGVIAGDWVFAVGNDWDRAIARTPVIGQELVHQKVDTTVGDTFWVQSTTSPSAANGLVDIHDTQPTNDRWNYAAVEIVATHQ